MFGIFLETNNGASRLDIGFESGKVGQAFSFDGDMGSVDVWPGVASFGANPFTVDFWMYSLTNGVRDHLVGKAHPDGAAGHGPFNWMPTGFGSGGQRLGDEHRKRCFHS